jgi:signal transduction histidine kinase
MRFFKNNIYLNFVNHLKFLLVLSLTLGANAVLSQNRIDSLEAQLKKDLSDSLRVNTLLILSNQYEYVDVTRSREYAREAIRIADEKSLKTGIADAHQSLGSIYRVSGDYQSALREDNKALEASLLLKDSLRIAMMYNNVGHDYFDMGEYDEAYHYFLLSYRYSAARDSLIKSINLHNIGRVFKELGQYERAKKYLNMSRALSQRIKDLEGEPYSLAELGDIMLRQGRYDSALATLHETLSLSRSLGLRVLQPKSMINIAQTLVKKKEYAKALAYYDTAFMLYDKTNDKFGLADVNSGRGLAYLSMQRFDDAMNHFQHALQDAREINARNLELQCFQHLSTLWEQKGDYKKALDYYKLYEQTEDTLFSQDMQSRLMQDHILFETASKDSQIAALNLQQAEQKSAIRKQEFVRNILVVVMALSGILLITVYRSGQRRRKINKLLLEHQEEMEKRSEELEKLNQVKDKFFSIISHDLRSPINALAGLLDLMDKGAIQAHELPIHVKELRTRFNHTRTLLNNLLDWTLLQMDKLNLHANRIDLHKIASENIELMASLQGKEINIVNEIPNPAIAWGDSNTINLVIRNLLTNAIKFTNDGGNVYISGTEKDNEWLISVRDNGIGMKPEIIKILFDKTAPYTTRGTANEKGTGLGLILCKEFVEKNGGTIWVESMEGNGSTFYFTLPKNNPAEANSF